MLAYYPPSPRDGKFHRVEVRVKRPGVTVRSRRAYTAAERELPGPGNTTDRQASRALLDAVSNAIPLSELRMRVFAAPFRAVALHASVLLGIEMVGRDLALDSASHVEISYVAVDAQNRHQGFRSDRLDMNLEPATRTRIEQTGVRVVNRIELPPGRYQLRVAAHDPVRRATGSVIYEVDVPDFPSLALSMSGLVLMSKSGSALITAHTDEQVRDALPAPPVGLRTFSQNDALAVFGEVYAEGLEPAHAIDIVTTVRSETGVVVFEQEEARESTELQDSQGAYRYTTPIPLEMLEPGPYVLTVEARSRLKTELTASRRVRFDVARPGNGR